MLYNGSPTMAVMTLRVAEATTTAAVAAAGAETSTKTGERKKGFYRHSRTSFHHTKLIELRVCSVDGTKP